MKNKQQTGIIRVKTPVLPPFIIIVLSVFLTGIGSWPVKNTLSVATLLYRRPPVLTQDTHGLERWKGKDYSLGCNTPLYAIANGTVTYSGLDNYNHIDAKGNVWPQSTMLSMKFTSGTMTLLHLRTALVTGQSIHKGQVIGYESDIGWATGCHVHLIWDEPEQEFYYGQRIKCSLGYCRMSHYVPSAGGINCDSGGDCLHTANGSNVKLLLSLDDTYCAAPVDIPFGERITWDGGGCIKADTGGYIRRVNVGEYDPALNTINTTGYPYYWIDILQEN